MREPKHLNLIRATFVVALALGAFAPTGCGGATGQGQGSPAGAAGADAEATGEAGTSQEGTSTSDTQAGSPLLGTQFPDFTATDTTGAQFSLSEQLKTHDAVVINLWATWCPPCRREFPDLEKAYQAHKDSVAFIALSCDDADTMEAIEGLRQELGITFPMGSDTDTRLGDIVQATSIPTTVVVDRFGNVVFHQVGMFGDEGQIGRVLDAFVGEGYTRTQPLASIPPETSTAAFPVAGALDIVVTDDGARRASITWSGQGSPIPAYVVGKDVATLRLFLGPEDRPEDVIYADADTMVPLTMSAILSDSEGDLEVEQTLGEGQWTEVYLASSNDEGLVDLFLVRSEGDLDALVAELGKQYDGAAWQYEDEGTTTLPDAYTVRVVDQHGNPIPGVTLKFCDDEACIPVTTDEDGVATCDAAAATYSVAPMKVPEGYSFDSDFELTTEAQYGQWLLRIRRDEQ